MRVSFVIPHRQNLAILQASVRSVRGQQVPVGGALDVLVVDNASAEGASDWAESEGCQVIRLTENQGFGRAVNQGIRASDSEWIVVMNDDVELDADWLVHVASAIEQHPQAWFVCGKTLQFSSREKIDGVGDAICRGGASWRLGNGRNDSEIFNADRETFFPSATATAFRRAFFDRVGVFDETFFAYLEDVDLGLRAGLADLPGVYAPQANAYHRGSATGKAWSAEMVRWITGHQLLLLAKFFPARLLLRNGWRIFIAQALWAGLAVSRGRLAAWFSGLALGLRSAALIRREGETQRSQAERLAVVLADSERQIKRVQQSTGFDRYWAWYFRLTEPPWRKTV